MKLTRIDPTKLKADLATAGDLMAQIEALLAPHLVALTDTERLEMPKARENFDEAGRSLARAAAHFPQVAAVSGFEPAAVVEDLDNAATIKPLAERAESLSRRLADSRLTWLAEAWVPSLTAYGVAKVLARQDGKMRDFIAPLASVFAVRRARRTENETE